MLKDHLKIKKLKVGSKVKALLQIKNKKDFVEYLKNPNLDSDIQKNEQELNHLETSLKKSYKNLNKKERKLKSLLRKQMEKVDRKLDDKTAP